MISTNQEIKASTNESGPLWIEVTTAREHQGDTRDTRDTRDSRAEDTERAEAQEEKVERSELQEPTLEERRRSSINIYQGQSKPLNHTASIPLRILAFSGLVT